MAAAIATAAHLAPAASYLLLRDAVPAGAPQAPLVIVELAPVPVAPASDLDLAVGPLMRESPTSAESKSPEQPQKVEPAPQAPAVATVEPKPRVQAKPERAPAPRTAALPRSPVHTGSLPAAPAPGSVRAGSFPPSWINLLFSHLLRYRQYPSSAQAAGREGIVTLSFTMDRTGRVLARRIVRSSGVAALDAEALAMIERAQPLPPFPPEMTASTRSFTAPIKFSLR
jgi:protein TonB